MSMERLDGFTPDGFGKVIPGEIVDGDVIREGTVERRYYAPVVIQPPPVKPSTTKQQILDQIAALKLLADQLA